MINYLILIFLFLVAAGIEVAFWYKFRDRFMESTAMLWGYSGVMIGYSSFGWFMPAGIPFAISVLLSFVIMPALWCALTFVIFRSGVSFKFSLRRKKS